jgi:hypothetical protein
VSQAYIASLDSGSLKNSSLVILRRIAKALGVPMTDLVE